MASVDVRTYGGEHLLDSRLCSPPSIVHLLTIVHHLLIIVHHLLIIVHRYLIPVRVSSDYDFHYHLPSPLLFDHDDD